jgi:hypothetical protein
VEFCRRTRVWRTTESFTYPSDDDGGCEAVAVEDGRVVYEISHARFGDIDLDPVTIDWLDKERPGWRDEDAGQPEYVTQTAPDTVRLVPVPDEAGTLALQLILVPSQDAEQVPDMLIEHYAMEIADGALGRVLMLPAEFGNAELGAAHAAAFEHHLGRWSDRVQRGQQRSRRRTRPSSYF